MKIGLFLLTIFFISLPWVWYSVPGVSGIALRPSVLAAIPLSMFFFWKKGLKFKDINIPVMMFLAFTFLVWILPSFYNENAHWSKAKILSVYVYAILAYFSARVYLMAFSDESWNKFWPYIGLLFLLSCMYSYYMAFGSLIPNTNIASSNGFIQNALYGNLFDPTQKGGRGIRHTMAIVPTILLALSIHSKFISPKINMFILITVMYLVLYTFSRSAWLVMVLMMFLIVKLNIKEIDKNIIKMLLLSFLGGIVLVGTIIAFPEKISWVGNILTDRVTDSQSTDGRLWVLMHTITDTSFTEYLIGNNSIFQQSPHNMIFDSLMQSGILGAIMALYLFYFAAKIYKAGLFKGGMKYVVPAAFVTPALIRMLTAGSGMLHIAELFGLCVAANMGLVSVNSNESTVPTDAENDKYDDMLSKSSVRLRK